jgi:hypothetical protein
MQTLLLSRMLVVYCTLPQLYPVTPDSGSPLKQKVSKMELVRIIQHHFNYSALQKLRSVSVVCEFYVPDV